MKALVLHHERCPGRSPCEVICGLAHSKENNPKEDGHPPSKRINGPSRECRCAFR